MHRVDLVSRSPATLRAAFLLLSLVLAAPSGNLLAAELHPVPDPELESMEAAVRRQLQQAQAGVARLVEAGDRDSRELALAFGGLAQLYFLYELDNSAQDAFENARALDPNDFRWPYYLGVIAQDRQDLDRARLHLEQALSLRPDDLPTLLRLGRLALAQYHAAEATSWFDRARSLAPASAPVLEGLGQAAWLAGETELAIERLTAALERDPTANAMHYQLAMAFRDLGRMEEAKAHLEQRGSRSTTFADPLIASLGRLAQGATFQIYYGAKADLFGDRELAEERYRLALETDPDNLMARKALSGLLMKEQDAEAAQRELEVLLETYPNDATTRVRMGTALLSKGDFEGASAHFREAVRLAPDYPEAHLGLATALEQAGNLDEAEDHCRTALQLDPASRIARLQLGKILTMGQRYDEAATELLIALSSNPEDTDALLGLATVQRRSGQPAAAAKTYEALLESAEETELQGIAHLQLGQLALDQGALGPALDHLEAASSQLPGMVELHLTLANLYGRQGRFSEAAEHFDKYVETGPTEPSAHFGRALAFMMAARYPEARERLEQSVARLPENLELQHALARLLATCPEPQVRDGARALEMAQEVFRQQQNLDYAETLAMAWAETGQFDEAVRWQQQILDRATAMGAANRLPALEQRLEAYRRREPARAPWLEGS